MSIILIEGFENYAHEAEMVRKNNVYVNDADSAFNTNTPWGEGRSYKNVAIRPAYAVPIPNTNQCTIGLAFKAGDSSLSSFNDPIFRLRHNHLPNTYQDIFIARLLGEGDVVFYVPDVGSTYRVIFYLPIGTFAYDSWEYWEISILFDQNGKFQLRRNGEIICNLTNIDTTTPDWTGGSPMGASTMDRLNFYITNDGTSFGVRPKYHDDLYISNTYGEFLGPVRMKTLKPNGDDSIPAQWTPSSIESPVGNYSMLNDETINYTTYVSTNTLNAEDMYTVESLPVDAISVEAVQQTVWAKKNNAKVRVAAPILDSGGIKYEGDQVYLSATNKGLIGPVYRTNPSGGAWTVSDVNNIKIGQKLKV